MFISPDTPRILLLQPNSGSTIERRIRRTNYQRCECACLLSSKNHTCNQKLLPYAILIQNKQTALNLLNNKQTIYLMSLSANLTHAEEQETPNYHNLTLLHK